MPIHFVSDSHLVPLHVEILQPKQLSIHEGGRAKWTCKVVSAPKVSALTDTIEKRPKNIPM
jgi:hypothetical protein